MPLKVAETSWKTVLRPNKVGPLKGGEEL